MNIFSLGRMVGTLNTSVYHASYGAVRVFTKAAAPNGSKVSNYYDIQVNSVHPSVIDTLIIEGLLKDEDKKKNALSRHLIGHFCKLEDVNGDIMTLLTQINIFSLTF